MKGIQILKAMAYNDNFDGFKGIIEMPEIVAVDDLVDFLEVELEVEIDVDDSLMDDFIPGNQYFYSDTPLTDETCQNDELISVLPVDNIVRLRNEYTLYFYEIED